ncbi:FabD/lysophospholipase-like protein [Aspergillus saccharolyticus JOP 1030-1]|uniref:FabD/lysophospholipase-like protein n=1 Tax=Aspergillus saccharolyticus JOP 1030-1 TaxID=1450539 RepID=A0A318ZSL3_9EURO|nr:FabD/lysophospholipase-like protein [Aspergillus saccharolyticus JOP 1030-1]PYH43058.1 FabD/lysophospholipase-like protein [Aspergillus saccharolyticus JOP 1030-1]
MQQVATIYGGEPNPLDSTGLCLLSLDGGGVRGLSTLYILKGLMDRLNLKRADGSPPKKPCEVFDLIGGTSTGGLIAIMLGRLEMDVDECITAYIQLMKRIFRKPVRWNLAASLFGNIEPRFDASKLEEAINQVVSSHGANPTDLFNNQTERGCRVFVCSISQETKDIVRLRSYPIPGKHEISATICEAARATSAATTFFKPVSIGARRFADGALGANNPVNEVEDEAINMWCSENAELKPMVKCFISIGTGNPGKKALDDNLLKFLSKSLPELTTQTERTEREFISRWRQHYDSKRYFRFNVEQGLQDVGLAEYQDQGLIEAATQEYLDHQTVNFRVRDCIQNLESKKNATDLSFAKIIEEYQLQVVLWMQWRDRARWQVPFERNPHFTGRKELLLSLKQRLDENSDATKRIAIIGLGGIGKTQLILELAHRVRKQYAVFWIPVNSLANLQTAFQKVAEKLRLPGCTDKGANTIELVQAFLSDESIGQWLLVLDNADVIDLWTSPITAEAGGKRLLDYMPQSRHGTIIWTTRDRKVATRVARKNIVTVPEMDESAASEIMRKYLTISVLTKADESSLPTLLQELTYLPLAIAQAAAYINEMKISLTEYKKLLSDQDDNVIELLSEEFEDSGRYNDIENAVAKTWLISFEQIRRRSSLAFEYLAFMACVDPKDIPQSLLPDSEGLSRKKKTDAVGILHAFSFITKRTDGLAFDMHRLVHLATRGWLKRGKQLSDWDRKAVLRLSDLLSDISQTNRTRWRVYLPHAQYAAIREDNSNENIIDLAQRCGLCLDCDGRYHEAEVLYYKVLTYQEKVLGPEHPDTLTSINNFGWVLLNQGKYGEADQGKYEEAEAMHRRALQGREKVLGLAHPNTLNSVNNLGLVLSNQGKYQEAEAMHRRDLQGSEQVLGPEHPDTLISVKNLNPVIRQQKTYEEDAAH